MPILIAAMVVVCMTTLGALLMGQGWTAARHALIADAHDSTLAIGARIDERFERHLTPGSVSLLHLARGPLMDAATLDERLRNLPLIAELLARMPLTDSIHAGYADGDVFLVRPLRTPAIASAFQAPRDAAYLVQSITREAGAPPKEEWLFFDRELRRLETRVRPPPSFDPRTRDWYSGALGRGGHYLSQPYLFFTTKALGLTQSALAPNRRGVVAIDQNVSELATILKALRPTPNAEIAVVGRDGTVYGYFDLERAFAQTGEVVQLTTARNLGVPALAALAAEGAPAGQTVSFKVDGADWFGTTVPLSSFTGRELNLLVAIPDSDLLATARASLARQLWWALALMAVLLAIGWLIGRWLGRALTDLTRQAEALTRFDFRVPPPSRSRIREIRRLDDVLAKVCVTIQNFLTTAETIGSEPGLDGMLAKVLGQTVAASGCSAGAVYLLDGKGERLVLSALADRAGAGPVAAAGATAASPPAALDGPFPPHLPLAAIEAGAVVPGTPAPAPGRLALPLRNRQGTPLGLVLLDSAGDASHSGEDFRAFAEKLSGALSASIETRQLFEAQKNLLDGFVLLIADAIDAKSPYTGGHCRRVPELATQIVARMSDETEGPFRDFHFTDEQRYEFHLGAWLHDCGKVTSPEHIIDKATKLEAIHNRIHDVRTRFEVLWRDAEIAHLQRLAAGAAGDESAAERDAVQAGLRDDFAFVAACNIGGEFMTDEAIARIREIAKRTWLRHFDDRLGLSREEEQRLDASAPRDLPAAEPLLADRPDHIVPWGSRRPHVEKGDPANIHGFDMKLPAHRANQGEIYNLSIGRGTLTDEDRFKINDHVIQTYIMLKSLPWPGHLARVPEIAATHHERMDGKGYPRHLTGDRLSTEERVMALADIFEALTASDRPYKPAKTLFQSLRIMAFMCKEGHLDPEVFRYFLNSRLWDAYAARHLKPEQRDAVDVDALCALFATEAPRAGAAS